MHVLPLQIIDQQSAVGVEPLEVNAVVLKQPCHDGVSDFAEVAGHDYGYAYGRKASHNPRFTDSVLDKDAERRGASPDRDHKHAGGQTRAETK